jgi:hypothetical protein
MQCASTDVIRFMSAYNMGLHVEITAWLLRKISRLAAWHAIATKRKKAPPRFRVRRFLCFR